MTEAQAIELQQAVSNGDATGVQRLLMAGVDVNAAYRHLTALEYAVIYNRLNVVRLLLAHGADPNLRNQNPQGVGSTPLHIAASTGQHDIGLALLKGGADPNLASTSGYTPLMGVMMGGHNEFARLLLEHGANPEIKGPFGATALWLAVGFRQARIVRLLLDQGANIDTHTQVDDEDLDEPSTLLELAERNNHSRSNEQTDEILQMLRQAEATR